MGGGRILNIEDGYLLFIIETGRKAKWQLRENRGLTQHDTFTYAHLNYLSIYTSSMLVSFPSSFLLAKFEFEPDLQRELKKIFFADTSPPPQLEKTVFIFFQSPLITCA